MNRFSPEVVAALSAIAVALVAGLVSFIVTVLSKEQKTSEFRQAWIDALRDDITEFVAKNAVFMATIRIKSAQSCTTEEINDYILRERLQEMLGVEATRTRILLRLNPEEHAGLIRKLNAVYGRPEVIQDAEDTTLQAKIEELIAESQTALKREWRRVKRGEPIFIITKWVSLAAALAAVYAAKNYINPT